jgi:hypothetical protein
LKISKPGFSNLRNIFAEELKADRPAICRGEESHSIQS